MALIQQKCTALWESFQNTVFFAHYTANVIGVKDNLRAVLLSKSIKKYLH